MFLEALTTCHHYDDILAEVVQFNRPLFDRWLIVTSVADEATRDLCRRHSLECLATDDFFRDGQDFDKGRAIDHGMRLLCHDGWVLHIDADIVLPSHYRESLRVADLDHECIYGCDRFVVRGWEQWQRLKASSFFSLHSRGTHHNVCFPEGFPMGARWADSAQGYVPIGFHQLVWGRSLQFRGVFHRRYTSWGHNDASRSDVQFGLLYDRRQRVLLPEVVAAHLESEKAAVGANWNGRTTRRFGPPGGQPGPTGPTGRRKGEKPAGARGVS